MSPPWTTTIPVGSNGHGDRLSVTVELRVETGEGRTTVTHEPCPPRVLGLSVTHSITHRGHDWGGGAGCPPDLVEAIDKADRWAAGMDRARAVSLVRLASRWHLNTIRAGCVHQEEQDQVLRRHRAGVRRRTTTELLDLVAPCPVTGYRWGSAWLTEPLPHHVVVDIAERVFQDPSLTGLAEEAIR